ncbi:MAG: chloride channel protein [Pseudomonadota bacterium]
MNTLHKNNRETPESENQTGPRILWHRVLNLLIALGMGMLIGAAAVAVFSTHSRIAAIWRQTLPTDGISLAADYRLSVGLILLGAALLSGQVLRVLHRAMPRGPADLVHAVQTGRSPRLRDGILSSLQGLLNTAGGASAGIFGPFVHFGGCMGALLQRVRATLPDDIAMGAGASAALAAVFEAPIGAALFAHEAILRKFGVSGSGPVLTSAFGAYWVSEQLMGPHQLFSIGGNTVLNVQTLVAAIGVGIASGLVVALYIISVTAAPLRNAANVLPLALRPLVPAAILFGLSPFLPHLLGSGINTVDLAMAGTFSIGLIMALLIGKILVTSLCLGFGFFGGVFAPALFIGALTGGLFDILMIPDTGEITSYAVLGAASCIAAVIGAPLASVVIVFELTGSYEWAVLSMISVVTTTQISRSFAGRSLLDRELEQRRLLEPPS